MIGGDLYHTSSLSKHNIIRGPYTFYNGIIQLIELIVRPYLVVGVHTLGTHQSLNGSRLRNLTEDKVSRIIVSY